MTELSQATTNRIEELWNDHIALVEFLQVNRQIQLLSRVHDSFRKTLIIAAASYFEVQMTQTIIDLYEDADKGTGVLAEFVRRKAIGRSFSSLFSWDSPNANSFYNLFGPEFAANMKQKVRKDAKLDESVKAFLEIGHLRNQLVHKNYADFQLEKTLEEIYYRYQQANRFLITFPIVIRDCITAKKSGLLETS